MAAVQHANVTAQAQKQAVLQFAENKFAERTSEIENQASSVVAAERAQSQNVVQDVVREAHATVASERAQAQDAMEIIRAEARAALKQQQTEYDAKMGDLSLLLHRLKAQVDSLQGESSSKAVTISQQENCILTLQRQLQAVATGGSGICLLYTSPSPRD